MKKIPYGLSDYKFIKENNYYFIDKTPYIEKLENLNERFQIFLRPRRFGKSLFLAMLEAYYDKYFESEFDILFKDSYIYNNPTPEKNRYLIMRFDFSGIDIHNLEESFREYLLLRLNDFVSKYNLEVEKSNIPIIFFNNIFGFLERNNLELMLLIDE